MLTAEEMIKARVFPASNYKAFWFNGKTIRIAIDPKIAIKELQYPEFYDVKITGYCEGNCPWCYMDSSRSQPHYMDAVKKINSFFGRMSANERPFQVAIGGGEPTSHPEFEAILKAFKDLGIEPNYTTNGMEVDDHIVNWSHKYCGGVAVSCHPHLRTFWERAAQIYLEKNIRLNFHIIISDAESIEYFLEIYNKWHTQIDYFVLLPYTVQGRAAKKIINWDLLVAKLPRPTEKIAFGAGFYPYLIRGDHNIQVSLYEPEIMSKFLDLKDMQIYPSSFAIN
jgi:sulfatase maturation enzyme AslB (radical SAM superfamily)